MSAELAQAVTNYRQALAYEPTTRDAVRLKDENVARLRAYLAALEEAAS